MTHDDDDDDDDEDQDSDHDDSDGDHDDSDGDKNGASANIGRLVSVRRGRFNKFWLAPFLFEDSFYFKFGKEDKESLKKKKDPFRGLIHVLFVLLDFQNMFYTWFVFSFVHIKL